ncbi:hypothetical protein HMPREF1316_0068 [Olsenella profusa F0195]|uniref:Uncharacterized protein n=1 Tax=Olsenella profusa F0195 TaxID=1125712 RepID=U2TP41_9ACTN|nr:hypothetical protein HMPREF1316_0068 [Olsenella profusa F0195]
MIVEMDECHARCLRESRTPSGQMIAERPDRICRHRPTHSCGFTDIPS